VSAASGAFVRAGGAAPQPVERNLTDLQDLDRRSASSKRPMRRPMACLSLQDGGCGGAQHSS